MHEVKEKVKQVLSFDIVRFGIVGCTNTLIDFLILNILFISLGAGRITANIISTTCAMAFSYVVNRKVVFRHHAGPHRKQIVLFLAVTLFGLYIIQTLVILFLTRVWHGPANVAANAFPGIDAAIIATNVAKVFATACTLIWNYIGYKYVVFAEK